MYYVPYRSILALLRKYRQELNHDKDENVSDISERESICGYRYPLGVRNCGSKFWPRNLEDESQFSEFKKLAILPPLSIPRIMMNLDTQIDQHVPFRRLLEDTLRPNPYISSSAVS